MHEAIDRSFLANLSAINSVYWQNGFSAGTLELAATEVVVETNVAERCRDSLDGATGRAYPLLLRLHGGSHDLDALAIKTTRTLRVTLQGGVSAKRTGGPLDILRLS